MQKYRIKHTWLFLEIPLYVKYKLHFCISVQGYAGEN